jgi:hypothetical protein
MMFEEKQIPYRIERINMRSYGDKPKAFLAKVRSARYCSPRHRILSTRRTRGQRAYRRRGAPQ